MFIQNIKFAIEHNENNKLPFLDVSISNLDLNSLDTSVYHKTTFTGLYLNFKSFVPFEYKTRFISTLLDRIYKITSNWKNFDIDVKNLENFLMRNLYPLALIEKITKRFLDKKFSKPDGNDKTDTDHEIRYAKLPYIGQISKSAKNKIENLVKTFCKENIKIRLIFTTCKIGSYFSTKDVLPKCFKSNVIYKFTCAGCNSCYVGRTHVYFDDRRTEHFEKDKNSGIFKHFQENQNCKIANTYDSFKILDNARTNYELALKEAMHIKWENPRLNGQKYHEIIQLLI